MVIEKGRDWGERGVVDVSVPLVDSDAGLADLFSVEVVDEGASDSLRLVGPSVVGLLPYLGDASNPRLASGGLARTVGARGSREALLGKERALLPIDLGVVTFDRDTESSRHVVVAAGLVVCNRFWSGTIEGAMNAAFLGEWNVAPGGHPNDGRFDVITANLSLADRFKARKRLASGSHIPHPDISIRRLKAAEFAPRAGTSVWIDGRRYSPASTLHLSVFADAVSIAI